MAARLRELYQTKVVPTLTKEFSYKNTMAVPRIEKISINIGLGEATQNGKLMDGAVAELGQIAGRSRSSPRRRNPSRSSSCAKARRSAAW